MTLPDDRWQRETCYLKGDKMTAQYNIAVERRFLEIAEAERIAFKLAYRALYCGIDKDAVAPLYGSIRRLSFCENPSSDILIAVRKMLAELSKLANPHL